MITVGVDGYITALEADELISSCHKDSLAENWLTLSTEDKEAYIRSATYRIDCLPIGGFKHSAKQQLQFPRGMSSDIPHIVKLATAEEALSATDEQLLKRIALQQQGVESVTLGSASESYNGNAIIKNTPLLSQTAYNYMQQYIVGSVRIK